MLVCIPAKTQFKRILVPTDFTDVSDRAVSYARNIARLYDAKIVLAHVNEPINPIAPPEIVWFDELTELKKDAELLESKSAELRGQGFRAETASLTGTLRDEILSAALQERSEIIVLGSHGRSGIMRILFGSEAEVVYRQAACPILVVGPHAPQPEDKPWHPRDIVCATNLDPDSAPAAAYAYLLAQEHQATFTLFHVIDSTHATVDEVQAAQFEKALAEHLPENEKPVFTARTLMIGYRLGSTITDFAKERHSDLIVLGAHPASAANTHMPRGIAPEVISEAHCPVMILHSY